ncbi:MAG: hypothetical protein HZA46_00665 [Planctomycetales bacterium]|nr:hypothetical protein [Planctomycetales bacterium]
MLTVRRQMVWGLVLTAAVISTLAIRRWSADVMSDADLTTALRDPQNPMIRGLMKKVQPLHTLKRPSQPGEWLDKHVETGQTFDEYLAVRPTRVVDRYSMLYLQPLGRFTDTQFKIMRQVAEMLHDFYGLPVKTLDPVSLDEVPEAARREKDNGEAQLLTSHLLQNVLKPRRRDDAAAVLGLTATDLWPGKGWNFVFGQASLDERVGVWSLARFGDPDAGEAAYRQCLRRTVGVALHETGHMLGILHCTAYECSMNGSNHLEESDSRPLDFCPECSAKVWWACRVDPTPRYAALADLAEKNGLRDDAQLWRRLSDRAKK